MAESALATHSLEVRRVIAAPPASVYDAWTVPTLLTRWFAPSDEFTVVVHVADTREGGKYRIEMRHRSGASHIAIGEYRELARPSRLAFTWRWEGSEMPDTLVTIDLRPADAGTELVLTHSQFPLPSQRDEHTKGWTGCLSRIEAAVVS